MPDTPLVCFIHCFEARPTGKLLHKLPADTEQHAVSEFLLAILEQCCPRATRCSFPLLINGVLDLGGFSAQVGFIYIQLTAIGVEAPDDY